MNGHIEKSKWKSKVLTICSYLGDFWKFLRQVTEKPQRENKRGQKCYRSPPSWDELWHPMCLLRWSIFLSITKLCSFFKYEQRYRKFDFSKEADDLRTRLDAIGSDLKKELDTTFDIKCGCLDGNDRMREIFRNYNYLLSHFWFSEIFNWNHFSISFVLGMVDTLNVNIHITLKLSSDHFWNFGQKHNFSPKF